MFWLNSVNEITISRFSEIDRTGNISLLRKWYNPFPVNWFNTELFFDDFKELFNVKSNLGDEKYKIIAYNKILILERMLKTMTILMQNQNERSLFSLMFDAKQTEYKGNLKYYIERIKFYTGIEINDLKDIERLRSEVIRLIDKYNERFANNVIDTTKTDFIDICFGVFTIMEMNFIPDMKLTEFARLKKLSDKRIQKMKGKK